MTRHIPMRLAVGDSRGVCQTTVVLIRYSEDWVERKIGPSRVHVATYWDSQADEHAEIEEA